MRVVAKDVGPYEVKRQLGTARGDAVHPALVAGR